MSSGLLIEPSFSKQLGIVLIAISLFAISVVCCLPIQNIAKALLVLCILIWLLMVFNRHGRGQVSAIQQAQLRSDNSWQLVLSNGQIFSAVIMSAAFVQPWLTVLQFQLPNRRKVSLILLADNIDADLFRRLRVRLLHSSSG